MLDFSVEIIEIGSAGTALYEKTAPSRAAFGFNGLSRLSFLLRFPILRCVARDTLSNLSGF